MPYLHLVYGYLLILRNLHILRLIHIYYRCEIGETFSSFLTTFKGSFEYDCVGSNYTTLQPIEQYTKSFL